MKVISWDVGIIHLAYCILEKDDDNDDDNDAKILDWGNINLLNNINHECNGFINSSKSLSVCNKPCKFYYQSGGNTYNFCGLHKKQYMKIEQSELIITKYKGDEPCNELTSNGSICGKKSNSIIDNKILCNYHCKRIQKKHNDNDIKKIIIQSASKAPIEEIKRNLIDVLDKNMAFLDVDYVLIENQPSMKNPKMKSVAETLFTWFMIRGLVDKPNGILKKIYYLSPSNKIKVKNDDIDKELSKITNESLRYKFTKNIGIIYTKDILKNDTKWLDLLNESKKKDDLCDSFLQGLYFYNNINKFVK
jgi:hypothetical protein